jgi:beta-N-acetylhexosaminidase
MVGIGFGGTTPTAEARALFKRGVANCIVFARNYESPQQFFQLTREVKSLGQIMMSVDQEGGRVLRMREPFTLVPSMRQVGQAGDEKLAYEIGRVLARELRAVNLDMNLAPVLDVDTNPGNPVISSRSFGGSTELVTKLGVAVLRGLQDNGVAACAKHFPGHGDTNKDSHHELPVLPHDINRLNEIELPPFKAAVEAGVASVMTAHVIYTPIDEYPGTLSREIINRILRKRLGFDGLVMSDDMQMKAISEHYGFDDSLILAANAGVDLFWICHSSELQNRAIDVLIKAAESGKLPRIRLEEASRRLDAVMATFVKPAAAKLDLATIGSSEHQAIAKRIEELAGETVGMDAEDPTERFVRQQKTS